MRKPFAILIGVAATGVMALGAQTAAAPDVVKYATDQYITYEGGPIRPAPAGYVHWEGGVHSKVRKCMKGRLVVLFRMRSGRDRKLGTSRTFMAVGRGNWGLDAPQHGRVYAEVRRKVGDGYVCRAAPRSRVLQNGEPIQPPHPF